MLKPPGTPSAPLASRFDVLLGQVFNVRMPDYAGGARGDGTTDDTAAVQAAINACVAAGGGVVFFPEGTYRITATLTAAVNSSVRLVGVGRNVSSLYWPTDLGALTYAIDFGTVSTSGVQQGIFDLSIVGPGPDYGSTKGQTSNQMAAVKFGAKFRAERCRFWKWKVGVLFYGDHQTVQSCDWRSCYYNIYFPTGQPTNGDQHIIDCTCVGATFASIGVAQAACYFQVTRSHFGFSPFGIYMEATGSLRGVTFHYGYFEGIGNAAIYGAGSTSVQASDFNLTVKHAGSNAVGGYPTDGYINVPNIIDCLIKLDGTTTSGAALGGTDGCLVKADMAGARFEVTQVFWDQLVSAGLVSFFKPQSAGAAGEPDATLRVGPIRARLVKLSSGGGCTQGDVLETWYLNTARRYQTSGRTACGIAMHTAALSTIVPAAQTGVHEVVASSAVALHDPVTPDAASAGKVKAATDFGDQIIGQVDEGVASGAVTCRLTMGAAG